MRRENKSRMFAANRKQMMIITSLLILAIIIPVAISFGTRSQAVNPSSANVGTTLNFTGGWSGGTLEKVFFCKDSACTLCDFDNLTQVTRTDGCWCNSSTYVASPFTCTATALESDDTDSFFYMRLYNTSTVTKTDGPIFNPGSPDIDVTINHRPNATSVAITPASPVLNSTLNCTYTFYDYDGDSENTGSAQYIWWNGTGGSFEAIAGQTAKTLSKNFSVGENVKCSVLVYDSSSFAAAGYVNSSSVSISNYTYSVPAFNANQYVTPDQVNVSDFVTFSATWSGGLQRVLVCKNDTCGQCSYNGVSYTTSGCYCYSSGLVESGYNCTAQVNESEHGIRFFNFRFYNSTSSSVINTDGPENYFVANGRPFASSVLVRPSPALADSVLSCNYTFNDFESDTEDTSLTQYLWWNGSGSNLDIIPGETTKNLAKGFTVGERVRCSVLVYDSSAFPDDTFVNSSIINITTLVPVLLNVSDNSNSINQTLPGANVNFTFNWTSSNTSISVKGFICSDSDITSSGCGATTYCNSSFTTSSRFSCLYNVRETDSFVTTYFARVCNSLGDCSNELLNGTFYKYNDSIAPNFNLAGIYNSSNASTNFISFRLTDNYRLDNTSVYLNITNSTSSTTTYPFANMSCTTNATSQLCNLTIAFRNDGVFNLTFFARDANNNTNTSLLQIINDVEPGNITNAQIGYYDTAAVISGITTIKTLFVNWSGLTGVDSGVARYEYAIGTGSSYGSPGWN